MAFVTDVRILKATDHKSNLDAVMKRLYFNYALQGKGISAEDYQSEIEAITGESWKKFFKDYVNGTKSFESIIIDALEYIGFELNLNPISQSILILFYQLVFRFFYYTQGVLFG